LIKSDDNLFKSKPKFDPLKSSVIFDFNKWDMMQTKEVKYQKSKNYSNSLHFEIHTGEIDNYYQKIKKLK